MNVFTQLRKEIEAHPIKLSYEIGAVDYALDLSIELERQVMLGKLKPEDLGNFGKVRNALLDGAKTWEEYSYSGRSLKNRDEIKKRLYYMHNVTDWFGAQAKVLKFASGFVLWTLHRLVTHEEAA